MVDFRNCVVPSSAPEVAPFPAGLNDCVSGLRWVAAHADDFGIDPERIVVAGESGGGNLTLATGLKLKRDGDLGLIKGLYALCPYIAGQWPAPDSLLEHRERGHPAPPAQQPRRHGLRHRGLQRAQSAGVARRFAQVDDVRGFPPTVINVNECDPLRDEGINFYRLLLAADVPARCRQMMGTMHGTEIFAIACPDVSRDTARDIAAFAARLTRALAPRRRYAARAVIRSPLCPRAPRAPLRPCSRRAPPSPFSPPPRRPPEPRRTAPRTSCAPPCPRDRSTTSS